MRRQLEALDAIVRYAGKAEPKDLAEAMADLTVVKMIAAEALAGPNRLGMKLKVQTAEELEIASFKAERRPISDRVVPLRKKNTDD
jgi:hypothetical protein